MSLDLSHKKLREMSEQWYKKREVAVKPSEPAEKIKPKTVPKKEPDEPKKSEPEDFWTDEHLF